MTFKISDHVEFDSAGRAICPSCAQDGKTKKRNLALVPDTDGAYKCHRGCRPEDIRAALGQSKIKPTPTALQPKTPPKQTLVSLETVGANHQKLMASNGPAKKWLHDRGISDELIKEHYLGICQVRIDKTRQWAISIPIAEMGTDQWHLKKRVAPWSEEAQALPGYQPWKQYGIPKKAFFAYYPNNAQGTYLCEGEWDAILLGQLVRNANLPIAVASFTCGCSSVPPVAELAMMPKPVTVFYDRNDAPLKNGTIPGDAGAEKAALAISDERGRIAKVPMPEGCTVKGWDVSDAINAGYQLDAFIDAAAVATKPKKKRTVRNHLLSELIWNDDLISNAPDYTEFLVPDLLTEDELFLLAAGPRTGKSLLAMGLAHAVAIGGQFMGRPCTQGTVVYVKCEDSDSKIKEREQAQGWGSGLPVAWLNEFKLSNMTELEELVEELDPRLVVLDTLSRIKDAAISESSAEMSQLLEPLQKMANKNGCCVLLVHHTGKVSADNAGQIDIFDTIRGSSAIRAVCRGSMVLAAGDREFRLVVENGWGKHDLKVVLDANTLTWKQLGKWSPPVNMSQQEQIIEALKKLGSASVDAIHQQTGIPKRSLYEQLSRLVNSEDPNCKLIKEGTQRKYTYRLALVNTIQLLTSVLTSENAGQESDRGPSQQNNFFPGKSLTSQISTSKHVPVELVEIAGKTSPLAELESVDYRQPNALAVKENASQQLVNSSQHETCTLTTGEDGDLSSDVTVGDGSKNTPKTGLTSSTSSADLKVGDRVHYTGGNQMRFRLCGRKKLTIDAINNGIAVVSHGQWVVTQSIDLTELRLAK